MNIHFRDLWRKLVLNHLQYVLSMANLGEICSVLFSFTVMTDDEIIIIQWKKIVLLTYCE
jgi:hypothetical protein